MWVRRMLFEIDPLILRNFWPTFTGTSLLPFRLVLRPILNMLDFLRKIDEDLGGSISWHTQPNGRVIFNMPLHFVTFLLKLFCQVVRQPGSLQTSTFLQICIRFRTHRTKHSGRYSTLIPRRKRSRRKIQLCRFCTLIDIATGIAIVSFRALPISVWLIISFSGLRILDSYFLFDTLFSPSSSICEN